MSLTNSEYNKVSPFEENLEGPIKIAIIDLYAGLTNHSMRWFQEIVERYKNQHQLNLQYQVFDTRGANEIPGTDWDIYICSGGPGDPLSSEGTPWDDSFMQLMNALEAHNASDAPNKKYAIFVCHSFQLMCRRYKLGLINKRSWPSYGVVPVHLTQAGRNEVIFNNLGDPFYTIDSRSWQVINPDENRFKELGMQLLAIEKERPHIDLPRAMMAIRYNDYFIGTQFHPEVDAQGLKASLMTEERKAVVINEQGQDRYQEILQLLDDQDKIMHTQHTLIPNFLDQAIKGLVGKSNS